MIIQNTDLGELFPLGLGTVGAGTKWSGADADRIFDTYVNLGGNGNIQIKKTCLAALNFKA